MIIPSEALPIAQYHQSAPHWLSKTSLRDFEDYGPAWWRMAYIERSIPRPRPGGVEQGMALDCMLTEGAEAFAARYPALPDDAPRRPTKAQREAKKPSADTMAAIAWWGDWDRAHPGAMPLSDEDRAILTDAVDAVRRLPCWSEIERARAQATVRRHSAALGLGLQSRPDWLAEGRGILWDLKKTRSLANFGKQAIDIGYHLQAAVAGWCLAGDGIALEHAYLVAVEWERGARARCYEIPHEALVDGNRRMREVAEIIASRIASGDWADVQPEPEPLPIPEWLMRRMQAAS